MSLYNMVAGNNVNAGMCLAMLHLDGGNVPRLRDAWLSDDGKQIVVLTRTGGGNREAYEADNDVLADHAQYVSDHDDDFDSTFAHFTFNVPEQYAEDCAAVAKAMALVNKGADSNGPAAMIEKVEGASWAVPEGVDGNHPDIMAAGEAIENIAKTMQANG